MNRKSIVKVIGATAFFTFFNLTLLKAQGAGDVMTSVVNYTPQFFIAIISGLILALAFQSVLTLLSVASGISLLGNLEEKASGVNRKENTGSADRTSSTWDSDKVKIVEADKSKESEKITILEYDKNQESDKNKIRESDKSRESERRKESVKNKMSTGVKITSGIGAWVIFTATVSLFLASLFAVKMIIIPSQVIGFSVGLVIWAAFFMVMMYLEAKSVSSLLGGIFNTAMQGIRSAFDATKSMLGKSDEDKMTEVAQRTVGAIHRELAMAMDNSGISRKIEDYINRMQPKEIDYSRVRNEIAGLLKDLEVDEKVESTDSGAVTRTFLKVAETHPGLSREQRNKIGGIIQEIKGISSSGGSTTDKLLQAVDKFTPGSEEDTRLFREKIEGYLRRTKKEELNPDGLKRDFEAMMRDPKSSREIIRNRIGMMNRSTVSTLLAQRTDMSEEEADKVIGYVEKALDFVKGKFSESTSEGQEKLGSTRERVQQMPSDFSDRIEEKIKNYFDSLNREELNYDKIKMDFQNIFHDPSSTFDILKNRLSEFDRDSLVALLSSSDRISREQAERIVTKIEEARDNVLWKAEKLQEEAKNKLEEAKVFAIHQAEETRKVAATAAWWLIAAAVVSGIASGLGGMIGIM